MQPKPTITIRGKIYTARTTETGYLSLLSFQQAGRAITKQGEAEKEWSEKGDTVSLEAFKKSWLDFLKCFLDGEVTELGIETLDVEEVGQINGFFTSVAVKPKQEG